MKSGKEARLLRIFISSTDKFKHAPLHEVIVFAARRQGLAGATVLRGVMGFGVRTVVYASRFWEVNDKVPMVIEIVDEREKIEAFLQVITPYFAKVKNGCLISLQEVEIILMKEGKKSPSR